MGKKISLEPLIYSYCKMTKYLINSKQIIGVDGVGQVSPLKHGSPPLPLFKGRSNTILHLRKGGDGCLGFFMTSVRKGRGGGIFAPV